MLTDALSFNKLIAGLIHWLKFGTGESVLNSLFPIKIIKKTAALQLTCLFEFILLTAVEFFFVN